MLRFLTAGESHGQALVAVLEGMPSGVPITPERINVELRRRQGGYGRGGRMQIEQDAAEILSGVRRGLSLGSPIALLIRNKDHSIDRLPRVAHPRPGHADLTGALKYDHRDIRNVLERASARETTARTAVGALCKCLLGAFDIEVFSHTVAIGDVTATAPWRSGARFRQVVERSPVRCADPRAERRMMAAIDRAKAAGDTLGGIFEVVAAGVPAGIGSYVHGDRRLDARLAYGVMSIQAVKAVEVGAGFAAAARAGSRAMDEIFYAKARGFYRRSNHSGGVEGGMSTGEPILVRGYLKPLSTLMRPLRSVHIDTKRPVRATVERSDVCTVPAAGVIGEAMVAYVIADAFREKFGGDSLREIRRNVAGYVRQIRAF